jgi:hypothetical protein
MRHLFGLIVIVFFGVCFSQQDSVSTKKVDTIVIDSVQSSFGVIDTTGKRDIAVIDTLVKTPLAAVAAEKKAGPVLIKRNYEFKSQVRLGIAMMLFIAVIFSTAQSWNP